MSDNLIGDLETYADELGAEGWHNAANGCRAAVARLVSAQAEIERLQRMWGEACKDYGEAKAEIERLRAALKPFAGVAEWAVRNGYDLHDFDMLLRGPGYQIAGHLQVQADKFLEARRVLSCAETVPENVPNAGNSMDGRAFPRMQIAREP